MLSVPESPLTNIGTLGITVAGARSTPTVTIKSYVPGGTEG